MSKAASQKTHWQKLLTGFVLLISRQTGKIEPVVLPLMWFEEVRLPLAACVGALGRRVWDARQKPGWDSEAEGSWGGGAGCRNVGCRTIREKLHEAQACPIDYPPADRILWVRKAEAARHSRALAQGVIF